MVESYCVYRIYDAELLALYVGCCLSERLEGRLAEHAGKPWWGHVALVSSTEYEGRIVARRAEARTIFDEQPAYNVNGKARLSVCKEREDGGAITMKVDADSHATFKAWCEARGLKIQWAASEALREYALARPGGAS